MIAVGRAPGLLAAMIASIWLVAALLLALVLHGHHVERQAHYADVDMARSFAAQGSPEFVALRGRVAGIGALALRRGHDSDATWYVPLIADQAPSTGEVHWIARYEGASLPVRDEPILGRHAGDAQPRVVRDELERMKVRLANDAVVVDWIPSRQGVVLDRDADIVTFGAAIAGFVSVICALGFAMLAILNAWGYAGSQARRAS